LLDKAVQSILQRQLPDGGFNIYPKGPTDLSATVKAYFALKLAGLDYNDLRLARARERILALGGIQAANSYVKVNLSLFDLFPRDQAPTIPPEMVLFGNFIYEMSSWTRAIVIPLSIVHAFNPRRPVPAGFDLKELFIADGNVADGNMGFLPDRASFTWRNVFLRLDIFLKLWEKYGSKSLRQRAIRKAGQWMLEHTQHTDGVAAIYPPMMYVIMALDLLGYPPDSPERLEAQRQFDRLMVNDVAEGDERFFFQPCFSVVWDTAIAAFALGEAPEPPHDALRRSADWLLTKEVRRKGDWSVKRPKTEPSGWYFEFANEFYPDIDDTAMVLLALNRSSASRSEDQQAAEHRAIRWLFDMQSKDGGWAAFDVDNDWRPLSFVPFADHNAMLDPPTVDITGRILEMLAAYGYTRGDKRVEKAIQFIFSEQESDGSWFGRWGVNYIYGTFLVLRGLEAIGVDNLEPQIQQAAEWIRMVQNPDGGWGETCGSYDDPDTRGVGPSTPSQTAWAMMGLLAAGDDRSDSVAKGVRWLLTHQQADGSWDETTGAGWKKQALYTGTGFPRVFYLSYEMYRQYFPLLALTGYKRAMERAS
jgi:squalene-hopene/tetraprenyl-beta-curcumene cyclase